MSEVEIEKEEIVTFTVRLSKERAKHIEDWLTWAFEVWSQMEQYPQLEDEVFHNIHNHRSVLMPERNSLNYDTLIMLRNGLRK